MRALPVSLFQGALAVSFIAHAALWRAAQWLVHVKQSEKTSLEIDLTRPFRLTSYPLLRNTGGFPARPKPRRSNQPPALSAGAFKTPGIETAAVRPEAWVSSGSAKAPDEIPQPDDTSADVLSGQGNTREERLQGFRLTRLPRLADRTDLERILRRCYPEEERRNGREADVILDMHIDAEGRVTAFEIVRSGGAAFDKAAGNVVHLLKFLPALAGRRPVAVKARQIISFRLE